MDWRTGGVELFTALARQQIHNVNNTLAKTPVHDIIHSPPSGSGTVIEFQWSDPTLASTRCNGSPPVKSPSPGGTRCTQIHKYKQTNIRIQTHRYTNTNTQIHKYIRIHGAVVHLHSNHRHWGHELYLSPSNSGQWCGWKSLHGNEQQKLKRLLDIMI